MKKLYYPIVIYLPNEIIKIPSVTIVIKSLLEKDNKFYLELALDHLSYQTIKK